MRPLHSIALAAVLAACGGHEKTTATPAGSSDVFTFARPKPGTKYTRVARWTRELSVLGSNLRRTETLAFTWSGAFSSADGRILRDEELTKIDVVINGKNLAVLLPTAPIKMRLTMDRSGRLLDVEGAPVLASALVSLLPLDEQTRSTKAAFREGIEETIASLQEAVSQDIAGKPAKVGSSWDADRPAERRHYTVTGTETCTLGTCTRVAVDVVPLFVAKAGGLQEEMDELTGSRVLKLADAKVTLRLSGLFDPRTMMVARSNVTQAGTFVFATTKGAVTIELKGTRDVEWHYAK